MGQSKETLWIALVTFERRPGHESILADRHQGASGWMGCFAIDSDQVRERLADAFTAEGLALLEVDSLRQIELDEVEEIDTHLALNICNRENGTQTIWGTIHAYLADGEA